MSAQAWQHRRAKNPYRNRARRIRRRGVSRVRPCKWCGTLQKTWQWHIGRYEMAELCRWDCGCWFDIRDAEGAARGRLNYLLMPARQRTFDRTRKRDAAL